MVVAHSRALLIFYRHSRVPRTLHPGYGDGKKFRAHAVGDNRQQRAAQSYVNLIDHIIFPITGLSPAGAGLGMIGVVSPGVHYAPPSEYRRTKSPARATGDRSPVRTDCLFPQILLIKLAVAHVVGWVAFAALYPGLRWRSTLGFMLVACSAG